MEGDIRMTEATPNPADQAVAAANRVAAVQRRRRESERTAFIRQLIMIVGAIAVAVAAVWVLRVSHRQKMERARLAAELAERQRAEEAAERQKIAEEQAAQREKDRVARQKVDEERLRLQKEQQQAREAAATAAKEAKENAMRFRACENRFRGAKVGRLSSAPDADRPDRVKRESTFLCLAPGGEYGYEIYEIRVTPGFPMKVERIRQNEAPVVLADDEFRRLMSSSPYLLLGGSHVYLRPDPAVNRQRTFPVPNGAVQFNPFEMELGGLAMAARKLGLAGNASFTYKVLFRPKGGGGDWPVMAVPFGGRVRRTDYAAAVRAELSRRKHVRPQEISEAQITSILDEGSTLFTIAGGL